MNTTCKSCGAVGDVSMKTHSFVCEYCGSKNVDESYLKDYASHVNLSASNKSLQLAMVFIGREDFFTAEQHLEACVLEDPNNGDAWLFLAYCKAALIKPSNFDKNFIFAKSCLEKASKFITDTDVALSGQVLVSNKFLSGSVAAAKYYVETGKKKYLAFSGSSQAEEGAYEETSKGMALIKNTISVSANDSDASVMALTYGLTHYMDFRRNFCNSKRTEKACQEDQKFFEAKLETLFVKRSDLVKNEFAKYHNFKLALDDLTEKWSRANQQPITINEGSKEISVAPPSTSSGSSKKMIISVVCVAVICILAAFFLTQNSKNPEIRSASPVAAPAQVVASVSVPEVAPLAPQPSVPGSETAPAAPPLPVSVPEAKLESASSLPTGFLINAPSESKALLTSMLANPMNSLKLAEIKGEIEKIAKPVSGDRKAARALNEKGLQALKADKYTDATSLLQQAVATDPADIEVRNNYVYALFKSKNLSEAEKEVGISLTFSSGRSSAWANLAEIYAEKGNPQLSSTALLIAFQFSSNKDKTLTYLKDKAGSTDAPAFAEAAKLALKRLTDAQ